MHATYIAAEAEWLPNAHCHLAEEASNCGLHRYLVTCLSNQPTCTACVTLSTMLAHGGTRYEAVLTAGSMYNPAVVSMAAQDDLTYAVA